MENSYQVKWEITTGSKVKLLDKQIEIEELYGGFGQGQRILTVPQIAKLHVDNPEDKNELKTKIKRINDLINNNRSIFIDNIDIINLKGLNDLQSLLKNKIYTGRELGNSKNVYILSETGYIKLIDHMKDKKIKNTNEILINYFKINNNRIIISNRKEIDFLDGLEENLKLFHIKGKKQYPIKNNKGTYYKIDYYIPELKIAIEYDENGHANYTYEQQDGRQKYIEKVLRCRFIRVTDNESNKYNIAYILSDIKNELHNYIINNNNMKNNLENLAFAITKIRIAIDKCKLNKNTLQQELFETQIQKEYFDNKLKELVKLKTENNKYKQIIKKENI